MYVILFAIMNIYTRNITIGHIAAAVRHEWASVGIVQIAWQDIRLPT